MFTPITHLTVTPFVTPRNGKDTPVANLTTPKQEEEVEEMAPPKSNARSRDFDVVQCIVGSFCCVLTSLVLLTIFSVYQINHNELNTNNLDHYGGNSNSLHARQQVLRGGSEAVGTKVKMGEDPDEPDVGMIDPDAPVYSSEAMSVEEVLAFLNDYIRGLHQRFVGHKKDSYKEVWKLYHDYTLEVLYPWDREYLQRMPERRKDGSVFLSLATYRDENCFNTLKWAYEKAKYPDKLFTGLVQQNCVKVCLRMLC